DGSGLAVLLLHRHVDGDSAHPAHPDEDRARPSHAAIPRDGVGRRLPVPAVMVRGSLLVGVAAAAAAGAAGAVYGTRAGVETLMILLGLGATTMLLTRALIAARRRFGGLRRQVVISGVLIAGQVGA